MPCVETWLDSITDSIHMGSTNTNADSKNLAHWQEVEQSYIGRSLVCLTPPPRSLKRCKSVSSSSDTGSTHTTLSVNSDYRSTWELLRGLPSRATVARIRTTLPTHFFSVETLVAQLPNRKAAPLPPSMFEGTSTASAEGEVIRILDLRERLRIEEIFLEMQIDMEQLYVNHRIYNAATTLLANVRILITHTCASLSYIQDECIAHSLVLDISSIDKHRINTRPDDHPFHVLSHYLKPTGWAEFNNFKSFEEVEVECGNRSWDEILAADEYTSSAPDSSPETWQIELELDRKYGIPPPPLNSDLPDDLILKCDEYLGGGSDDWPDSDSMSVG